MNTATIQGQAPQRAPAPKRKSRMSVDNVKKGKQQSPPRVLLYGAEKIGKSTFAAGAPSPIWLGAEKGTDHLDIERMPEPETWTEVLEGLEEIKRAAPQHGWKTLVVDPLNWLEALLLEHCTKACAGERNRYAAGGMAVRERRVFLTLVESIWLDGLGVIFLAHSKVKKFADPESEGYERYELDMPPSGALIYKQWVDAILFARRDFRPIKIGNVSKGSGSGAVYMHTQGMAAYDAGNRWSLPPRLPLAWSTLEEARMPDDRAAAIRAAIEQQLEGLDDPELTKKVRGYLEDPHTSLTELQNALAAKLEERAAATTNDEEATTNENENEGDTEQ